jgi:hypothetical protein
VLFFAAGGYGSSQSAAAQRNSTTLKKSIRGWTACNGVSDDSAGVARAFAEARHGAFVLLVDCPVRLQSAMDIARTIFIDDGTTVEFTASGKMTLDNIMHPAFVIANSKDIALTNWNIEYDAATPISADVGGYIQGGKFKSAPGTVQPAGAFNNFVVTPWFAANRGITYDRSQGAVTAIWSGGIGPMAIILMSGDTSNVRVTGMRMHVPAGAGVDRFIPVAFTMSPNFKSNQVVTRQTPITGATASIPHDLEFSDIDLDGTYMGWLGSLRDSVVSNVRSHRYGDLQDPNGENVGGAKKWFAPPHLFYLNYAYDGDPALFNRNIRIKNVLDDGPRVGTARDKGGQDSISGYALSLKIGCVDCDVDTYKTTRPDGFLDVLPAAGLSIENVDATYDSTFLNNTFPGWRFPSSSYKNLTFKNIIFNDSAASSVVPPISNSTAPANEGIVFSNVQVNLNGWSGKGLPIPNILGNKNSVALNVAIAADSSRIASLQKGSDLLILRAVPATLSGGGETTLTWSAKGATACAASGAWSGALAPEGTRAVALAGAGTHDFTFTCQGGGGSLSTTLRVTLH